MIVSVSSGFFLVFFWFFTSMCFAIARVLRITWTIIGRFFSIFVIGWIFFTLSITLMESIFASVSIFGTTSRLPDKILFAFLWFARTSSWPVILIRVSRWCWYSWWRFRFFLVRFSFIFFVFSFIYKYRIVYVRMLYSQCIAREMFRFF